ncbi:MAG: arginyltransferase [bacterium]|nr:arginyltransferase [bacterium]
MILIQDPRLSEFSACTYIEENDWRFEYFFALDLDEEELNIVLENGWRKFGAYYFRPNCENCFKCVPLRVLTEEFKLSRSQKRVLKKGSDITVTFGPLQYSPKIYALFQDHSENRFGRDTDEEDFISSFYTQSCPSVQSEYYLDGELIAVGFLDRSSEALSSVYFVYNTAYEYLSLGTLSVLKEIEYAASLQLKYYYLGYYVAENGSMAYKNRYHPNEKYNWHSGEWEGGEEGDR